MKCQRWMLEDTSIKYRFHSWVEIRALRLDSGRRCFSLIHQSAFVFPLHFFEPVFDRVFFCLHLPLFPSSCSISRELCDLFFKKRITLQLSLTYGVCKIRWHFVSGAQISRTCARILSPFYFCAEGRKGFSQNRAQIFHYSGEKQFEKLVHKSQYYSC